MSSRTSEARQKAALAKLRLSQAQRASQLEQETMEAEQQLEQQTREAEQQLEQQAMVVKRQLEQQMMDLKRQQMEQERQLQQKKMELKVSLEKGKAKIQAKKKLSDIADEVEQCEFEARLIEEGENAEDEPAPTRNTNTVHQLVTMAENGAESVPRNPKNNERAQPIQNDADRTARWVNDQSHAVDRTKETRSNGTWIDDLEDQNRATGDSGTENVAGSVSCPLPRLTLEKFDGDPLHWPRWIALFRALVHDRRELSNAERLTHLQSSLTGAARHAVSGLLCDGSLYGEALRELQDQFGSRATVVQASLRSVLQLPPVRANDIPGLTELSRALHSTVNVLHSLHYGADLAASTNVTAVVAKLPTSMAWKWGEHLQTIRHREPTMVDLDSWLRAQVSAARVVMDGTVVHTDDRRETGRRKWGNEPIRADRPASVSATAATLPTDKVEGEQCGFCGRTHRTGNCEEFIQLPMNERVAVVMRRAMCFRCLERGHRVRECVSKQRCSVDGCSSGRHHHLLHEMDEGHLHARQNNGPVTENEHLVGAASVGRKDQVLLQFVPVYVHGPYGIKQVNALLDLGSEISLVTERTSSQLGLDGPVRPLRISTIDSSQKRLSRRVDLEIQPLSSDERFNVTNVQTTRLLNVPGQAINWPAEKLKWPHLRDLNLQQTQMTSRCCWAQTRSV